MASLHSMRKQVSFASDYGRIATIASVDVTTTRTVLVANTSQVQYRVKLHNGSGQNVYVSDVMAHANFEDCYLIINGVPDEVIIGPGQTLYGVHDGATSVTRVIHWQWSPIIPGL